MKSQVHNNSGLKKQTKKILVTGSSGFIGSAITIKLEEEGFQVFKTTRIKSEADGKRILYLDLFNSDSIISLFFEKHFDVIVHFGARIGWSSETEKELFMPNVIASGLLANLASNTNAKFIFSSAAILCGSTTQTINKDSNVNADTPYGKSKWLAEELIKSSGVRYCILRIGGVFGLNGPRHLSLNHSIQRAINRISPELHGDGKAQRNYIYLWDIAETIVHVINNNIEGTHLVSGTEINSIKSMLYDLCNVFIPGEKPVYASSRHIADQLIIPSDALLKTRTFRSALEDIKDRVASK